MTELENNEKIRVQAHEEALAEISGRLTMVRAYPGMSSVLLVEHLAEHTLLHANREWEEFSARAIAARDEVTKGLTQRLEARLKYEAELRGGPK